MEKIDMIKMMHDSIKGGFGLMVEMMLGVEGNGWLINTRYGEESNTPLHWACINGDLDMIKLLLSKGARQLDNDLDLTPLEMACQSANVKMLEMMLKSIQEQLISGIEEPEDRKWIKIFQNALLIACKNNTEEIISMLLDHRFASATHCDHLLLDAKHPEWKGERRRKYNPSTLPITLTIQENNNDQTLRQKCAFLLVDRRFKLLNGRMNKWDPSFVLRLGEANKLFELVQKQVELNNLYEVFLDYFPLEWIKNKPKRTILSLARTTPNLVVSLKKTSNLPSYVIHMIIMLACSVVIPREARNLMEASLSCDALEVYIRTVVCYLLYRKRSEINNESIDSLVTQSISDGSECISDESDTDILKFAKNSHQLNRSNSKSAEFVNIVQKLEPKPSAGRYQLRRNSSDSEIQQLRKSLNHEMQQNKERYQHKNIKNWQRFLNIMDHECGRLVSSKLLSNAHKIDEAVSGFVNLNFRLKKRVMMLTFREEGDIKEEERKKRATAIIFNKPKKQLSMPSLSSTDCAVVPNSTGTQTPLNLQILLFRKSNSKSLISDQTY